MRNMLQTLVAREKVSAPDTSPGAVPGEARAAALVVEVAPAEVEPWPMP